MPRWSDDFPRYVPAAERRARLARERLRFGPEAGVTAAGRKIVGTFWGEAWARNLERYSDFANRLPRGRSYLRSGAVLELTIEAGRVRASVLGTSIYEVAIDITPLVPSRWQGLRKDCAGRIDSLVALLAGRLPETVIELVTREKTGLFPTPDEITVDCTCPDWADVCKHVAAVLYGVGVRLDREPELLFRLRGVDHAELVEAAPALWDAPRSDAGFREPKGDVSALFGIEIAEEDEEATPGRKARPRKGRSRRLRPGSS